MIRNSQNDIIFNPYKILSNSYDINTTLSEHHFRPGNDAVKNMTPVMYFIEELTKTWDRRELMNETKCFHATPIQKIPSQLSNIFARSTKFHGCLDAYGKSLFSYVFKLRAIVLTDIRFKYQSSTRDNNSPNQSSFIGILYEIDGRLSLMQQDLEKYCTFADKDEMLSFTHTIPTIVLQEMNYVKVCGVIGQFHAKKMFVSQLQILTAIISDNGIQNILETDKFSKVNYLWRKFNLKKDDWNIGINALKTHGLSLSAENHDSLFFSSIFFLISLSGLVVTCLCLRTFINNMPITCLTSLLIILVTLPSTIVSIINLLDDYQNISISNKRLADIDFISNKVNSIELIENKTFDESQELIFVSTSEHSPLFVSNDVCRYV